MQSFKRIFILSLICFSGLLYSQNEFSKWYFGYFAGLDFSTSPSVVMTTGSLNTVEGCATVCDNTGNLLFYTDGVIVRNSAHALMSNGTGLFGNSSSTQSAIIVKQPGNNNFYYIFTTPAFGSSTGVCYSIVDISLAAGLGSVTVKNASLTSATCEKQVAVRHCNGRDVWIVTHDYNSNQFRSFLLTDAGINSAQVISAIGETIIGSTSAAIGHIKISPDGKKLAMATFTSSIPGSSGTGGFYLFDFDAASGVVSNSLSLISAQNAIGNPYGVEFSADGTKLYGSTSPPLSIQATLFQWNVCASTTAQIVASQYTVNLGNVTAGSVQRAIDGKIYMAVTGQQSLNVINNPNGSGATMGFSLNALSIAPKTSAIGLPNYINLYIKPTPSAFTNSINCQSVNFTIPPVPTFSTGCSSAPYGPNGYIWAFGDPSTGSANSSTLGNPSHIYSATGTYTATLILLNPCSNDTLKKVITINTVGPNPIVTGPTTICKGDKFTYTVTGGSTYDWFNNTTASTIALSPVTNTVYSVSATSNGCTLSKTFSVTVSPCTGIAAHSPAGLTLQVFPNPFDDALKIETSQACTLIITDLNGAVISESQLKAGSNEINTEHLKAGIYYVKAIGVSGTWHSRIVKTE